MASIKKDSLTGKLLPGLKAGRGEGDKAGAGGGWRSVGIGQVGVEGEDPVSEEGKVGPGKDQCLRTAWRREARVRRDGRAGGGMQRGRGRAGADILTGDRKGP